MARPHKVYFVTFYDEVEGNIKSYRFWSKKTAMSTYELFSNGTMKHIDITNLMLVEGVVIESTGD